MKSEFLSILLLTVSCTLLLAQSNDSPAAAYKWKGNKTELQDGYVVLKSGKKLTGKISLKGSAVAPSEIRFEGDGKEVEFPAGALQSYGLTDNGATVTASSYAAATAGPVNSSPENMYEWRSQGIVMGKELSATVARAGYVELKNGTRYEGELRLKKKAGKLDGIEIKTSTAKEKFEVEEVAKYGLTVSQEEISQSNLSKERRKFTPGSVYTSSGNVSGSVSIQWTPGRPYAERVVFKAADGTLREYTPKNATSIVRVVDGQEKKYILVEGVFVEEGFNGKTFQLYLNPNPTSINKTASMLVKTAVQVGTTAASSEAVKRDAKKNNYTTNLDSIIRVSSAEDLIAIRDGLVTLSGFSTSKEAIESSDNESLVANLSALDLAIAGRNVAATEGGIMNREWIIINKTTKEKTVVYKSEYKNQIEPLLKGCYDFLSLSKSAQNDHFKWDNMVQAVKMIDGCY